MSGVTIVDIRHFLDDRGGLHPELPKSARHLCAIAEAGSLLEPDRIFPLQIRCRRRPYRQPCPGSVHAAHNSETEEISWGCPCCGDRGVITGWKHTVVDKRLLPDAPGDDPRLTALDLWAAVPAKRRHQLLGDFYCGGCAGNARATLQSAEFRSEGLVLLGVCDRCGGPVVRVIESPDALLGSAPEPVLRVVAKPADEPSSEPGAKPRCGLCGKSRKLTRTECCGHWICDDHHKYVMFSYARNSCSRNHDRFTLCAYHHNEGHTGAWQECEQCRTDIPTEMYVYYGTNEYNFEKLANPPSFEPTHCVDCGNVIRMGEDGYSVLGGEYRCGDCSNRRQERRLAHLASRTPAGEAPPEPEPRGRAARRRAARRHH